MDSRNPSTLMHKSHLKPELLPGLARKEDCAGATCYAERSGTKSNSSPSFCGTRSTTFGRSRRTTTRRPSSPKTGCQSCRAMTRARRTMRWFRPRIEHPKGELQTCDGWRIRPSCPALRGVVGWVMRDRPPHSLYSFALSASVMSTLRSGTLSLSPSSSSMPVVSGNAI